MEVIDKWLGWVRGTLSSDEPGKVKVKKITKVTREDLQRNAAKIQTNMDMVYKDITAIAEEMNSLDTTTEEGAARYLVLKGWLQDKNEIYAVFQKQRENNLKDLEQLGKSGRSEMILKYVVVVGGVMLSVIGLGLNRESPSILKVIDFILKPFRTPLKF